MPAGAVSPEEERQNAQLFGKRFGDVAIAQGNWAYFFMSIHAVNPHVVARFTTYDPYNILYANMVYGFAIMIYNRPAMRPLKPTYKCIFSILGSLMFNNASLLVFEWLANKKSKRLYLVTFLGWVSGRLMASYFKAYLYHIDLRFLTARDINRIDSRYNILYA